MSTPKVAVKFYRRPWCNFHVLLSLSSIFTRYVRITSKTFSTPITHSSWLCWWYNAVFQDRNHQSNTPSGFSSLGRAPDWSTLQTLKSGGTVFDPQKPHSASWGPPRLKHDFLFFAGILVHRGADDWPHFQAIFENRRFEGREWIYVSLRSLKSEVEGEVRGREVVLWSGDQSRITQINFCFLLWLVARIKACILGIRPDSSIFYIVLHRTPLDSATISGWDIYENDSCNRTPSI